MRGVVQRRRVNEAPSPRPSVRPFVRTSGDTFFAVVLSSSSKGDGVTVLEFAFQRGDCGIL